MKSLCNKAPIRESTITLCVDTTDAWLRQPELGIRQYFKSKQTLHALRVSIAETLSTFTISPKGLPDGCGDLERVESI